MKRFSAVLLVVVLTVPLFAQSVQSIEQPNRYKVYQNEIRLSPGDQNVEPSEVSVVTLAIKSNSQIESLGGDSRLGWSRSNSQLSYLGEDCDSRLGWSRSNSQLASLGQDCDSRLGWSR